MQPLHPHPRRVEQPVSGGQGSDEMVIIDKVERVRKRERRVEFVRMDALAPVAQAEVHRGRFRDLEDLQIAGRGMRGACRDVQALSGVGGDDAQDLVHAAVLAARIELGGIGIAPEADHQTGILAGAQHIPEFLLAEKIIALFGRLVVGMYPERHPAVDVQMPDTQGELPAVPVVQVFADHAVEVGVHHFGKAVAPEPARAHQRVAVAQVRQLELLHSPGIFVLQGAEGERIQFLLFFHDCKNNKKALSLPYG